MAQWFLDHVWFARYLVSSFRLTNMVGYTLEQRWQILRNYFENHDIALRNGCENYVRILEEQKHHQLSMCYPVNILKKLASSSIKQAWKAIQKYCCHGRKVCLKRYQHKFTVVLNNWTFRRQYWDEFCIKTLVWCHTK